MKKYLNFLKITAYFISSIIIFLCLVIALEYCISLGQTHSFVKVEHRDIGLLQKDEAKEIFKSIEFDTLNNNIRFEFDDNSWEIGAKDLDLQFDLDKTYENAFKLGRSGSFYKDIIERMNLWMRGINIPIECKISEDLTSKFINDIESVIKKEPISSNIFIKNLQVIITPSQIGLKLNQKLIKDFIENSLVHDNGGTFDLPVIYIEPLLDENKLINVKDEVEIIISNPITIKLSKDSYKLDRKKIANMVEFKKLIIKENGKEKLVVDVLFNDKLIKYLINSISYKIECVPIDARFIVEDEQVIIEPSIDGKKLIRNEFLSQFKETAHRKESRIFEAPILILKPKLTTEKADSMGIKELVSTDTEYFSSRALKRVHNIRLITSILDEILIAPHEIFLFNKTTGQRTKEKGFLEAPTIIQGELVDTFGGGVCNVSTTIFNTAYLGGYKIIERNPHRWYISRYPSGRDAAVSWGVQDFKFENDTDYWILIKGYSTKSSCTLSFFSTNFGREVEIITTPFSNFKSYIVKYKPDPEVEEGTEVVDSEGVDGRDVTVNRIISKDGEVLGNEKIFTRYYPKNKIILLNPKDYHKLVSQNQ